MTNPWFLKLILASQHFTIGISTVAHACNKYRPVRGLQMCVLEKKWPLLRVSLTLQPHSIQGKQLERDYQCATSQLLLDVRDINSACMMMASVAHVCAMMHCCEITRSVTWASFLKWRRVQKSDPGIQEYRTHTHEIEKKCNY